MASHILDLHIGNIISSDSSDVDVPFLRRYIYYARL